MVARVGLTWRYKCQLMLSAGSRQSRNVKDRSFHLKRLSEFPTIVLVMIRNYTSLIELHGARFEFAGTKYSGMK